jgi:dynein heavy chain 2
MQCCCCLLGSAGQLLSLAIQHEQPELETRKAQLLQQESSQKLQLTELEKQLLQALATSRCESVCSPS